jgi:hypothetical protein
MLQSGMDLFQAHSLKKEKEVKMAKKKNKKSDLALLFELASGQMIEDYLGDRAREGTRVSNIVELMNGYIAGIIPPILVNARLFRITESNVLRWYGIWKIKSRIQRGGWKGGKK